MSEIVLTGLDGAQALGFVAGLGVLEALSRTVPPGSNPPRLAWRNLGAWRPVVTGTDSLEEIAERILTDAHSDDTNALLDFQYYKVEKQGPKRVNALTPPVSVLRAWLQSMLTNARCEVADASAALICEVATGTLKDDKTSPREILTQSNVPFDPSVPLNVIAQPTPFDFTSRNTQFLDQIRRVRDGISKDLIQEELLSGQGAPSDRIMRWDMLTDIPAALFERSRPLPHPVAEWLFFRGLRFLMLSGRAGRVEMPGFSGRRKDGRFSWTLWEGFLGRDMVRTVLAQDSLITNRAERTGRGCKAAFTVNLIKDATGYDGSVTPSTPVEDS